MRRQRDFAGVAFAKDDKYLVLIVQNRLRSAAEEAEGVIVCLDRRFRPEGLPAEVDKSHPAVRQNHTEEVHTDVAVVHILHLELTEVYLHFIAGWRVLTEGRRALLRFNISGLFPKIVDIPEECRFPAVEVRELILYPIHNVGHLRLRADFQDAQDKSAVLFEIRGVVY